jgi:hypothetical protein
MEVAGDEFDGEMGAASLGLADGHTLDAGGHALGLGTAWQARLDAASHGEAFRRSGAGGCGLGLGLFSA